MKRFCLYSSILALAVFAIARAVFPEEDLKGSKDKNALVPFKGLWSDESSNMSPALAPDGKYIIFQSNRDIEDRFSLYETFLMKSGDITDPRRIELENKSDFDGQPYFSGRDGWILYSSIGPRNFQKAGTRTQADIWLTLRNPEGWGKPARLPSPVNSAGVEITPCISADGTRLYFASNRPGGHGGLDIWYSNWKNRRWSEPVNAGKGINSSANEIFPRLHADGKTLYFSSDRKGGKGGYDIYISRFKRRRWSRAANVGGYVNSITNDYLNGIPANASYVLLSRGSMGAEKIYKLRPTPEFMMPLPLATTRIVALDRESKAPIPMRVRIEDLRTNKVILRKGYTPYDRSPISPEALRSRIESSDDYFNQIGMDVFLETPGRYGIFIMSNGYLFLDEEFSLRGSQSSEHVKIFELPPLRKGVKLPLRSVYFKPSRPKLLKSSYKNLALVAKFLNKRKGIIVEIQGHTARGRGSEKRNEQLSRQRAKTVVKYLIRQGVHKKRLRGVGYGSVQPVAPNDSEANMKKNRRVEFLILDILKPRKKRKG